VVLGCNIHDEMVAYVQVVNTPHFGVSDARGVARLEGIANGRYALKAWYFPMGPNQAAVEQPLEVQGEGRASIKLNVKAVRCRGRERNMPITSPEKTGQGCVFTVWKARSSRCSSPSSWWCNWPVSWRSEPPSIAMPAAPSARLVLASASSRACWTRTPRS
jgi:hypothetical protein